MGLWSESLFLPLAKEAFVSLGGNRLRTFLAMLGIIIGVGSVILMLAVGNGSKRAIEESINALGTNQLVVVPGSTVSKGLLKSDVSRFEIKDVTAIAELPLVKSAAPATLPRNFQSSFGKLNWDTPVTATTPDYLLIRNWQFSEGEPFTSVDVQSSNRVVVLGATVYEKLFAGHEAIGHTVNIDKMPFRVTGVLKRKGQSLDGRDQDDAMFIPITTGKIYLWGNSNFFSLVQLIYVQVESREALDQVTEDITALLRRRFKLRETVADNFTVHNITAIKQVAADTNTALTLLLEAIASISLLVGSIGIMNIMLVTVTERTREIGIRKAVGATESQILLQFLLEAMMLCFVGSVIGLFLGFGVSMAAEQFAGLPIEFSLLSVLLSLIMAAGIGVISGLYPAWKAARMQPIEALRVVGG